MKWSTCQISAGDVLSAIGHMPILGDKKGDRRWFSFLQGLRRLKKYAN